MFVPVTVTVVVPAAAAADAVKVNVLVTALAVVTLTDGELKLAVTPLGKPVAVSPTVPVNPLLGVTLMTLAAVPPAVTLTLAGFADKLKFVGPCTIKVRDAE